MDETGKSGNAIPMVPTSVRPMAKHQTSFPLSVQFATVTETSSGSSETEPNTLCGSCPLLIA